MGAKGALLLSLLLLGSGCASFTTPDLDAKGAQASGFCIKGGPGGLAGIGPGGIIAGAKTNEGFKGSVSVASDCSTKIEAN